MITVSNSVLQAFKTWLLPLEVRHVEMSISTSGRMALRRSSAFIQQSYSICLRNPIANQNHPLPPNVMVLLAIKKRTCRNDMPPFDEVPSRVELLYTVLQTVT